MSDYYLRLIPSDPNWVPTPGARDRTLQLLAALLPGADEITSITQPTVSFVDPGSNLEGVFCPFCSADLDGWWQDALSDAYLSECSVLSALTPCCKRTSSLNDLAWKPSAGFARFVLEARNPAIGGVLPEAELNRVEVALGSSLRQVYAHV